MDFTHIFDYKINYYWFYVYDVFPNCVILSYTAAAKFRQWGWNCGINKSFPSKYYPTRALCLSNDYNIMPSNQTTLFHSVFNIFTGVWTMVILSSLICLTNSNTLIVSVSLPCLSKESRPMNVPVLPTPALIN